MRNVFDQYKQMENRLSHALAVTLSEDPVFLRRFIRWCGLPAPRRRVSVEVAEQSTEIGVGARRAPSIPDITITAGDSFCVLIESKVAARVDLDQIRRHQSLAHRAGFKTPRVVVMTLKGTHRIEVPGVVERSWSALYAFLGQQGQRPWTKRLLDYMDILEGQMIAEEYLTDDKLTRFRGIPFGSDSPYTYPESKRLLGLLMAELRKDKRFVRRLGIDPAHSGRPAIKGKAAPGVWDFLALLAHRRFGNHTMFPHLTVSISDRRVAAVVTIPDKVGGPVQRALLGEDLGDFVERLRAVDALLEKAIRRHRADGAKPFLEVMQRHYPSQSAHPRLDGGLQFDLRTAFPLRRKAKRPGIKRQVEWLEAAYALIARKDSNIQWGVGIYMGYDESKIQRSRELVGFIKDAFQALEPILSTAHGAIEVKRRRRRH